MKITTYNEKDDTTQAVELTTNSTVADLLSKLAINPVTVVVTRENNVLIETATLQDKDTVKIISVISGG